MPATPTASHRHSLWIPWLAALILIALFIRLGIWQLHRADEKHAILAEADAAPVLQLAKLNQPPTRYAQLQFSGRYDAQHHILLDNQVLRSRPGVHVWTPFITDQGPTILVNRGWLALPPDRQLPMIETPGGTLHLQGRVNQPPRVGRRLGRQDHLKTDLWPQMVTYLDLPQIEQALDQTLSPWIIQLSPESAGGFDGRHWPVVNFGPEKHLSYAWTWFTLAFSIALIALLLPLRAWRRTDIPRT